MECEADAVLAARLRPKTAAEYVITGNKIGADFKHGLSMAQSVERARALDAEHGELRRPPSGPALSGYAGKKATRNCLARVEHGRRPGGLARHPLCPGPEASGPLAGPRRIKGAQRSSSGRLKPDRALK
ncbi:hypothetical protein GCM10010277_85270 [Streptomyces longisporoflavus]|nr:hypothetical protein GCM10010277_85270 [Streptomyces longisporoflavus]